jgi:hypothetical protein
LLQGPPCSCLRNYRGPRSPFLAANENPFLSLYSPSFLSLSIHRSSLPPLIHLHGGARPASTTTRRRTAFIRGYGLPPRWCAAQPCSTMTRRSSSFLHGSGLPPNNSDTLSPRCASFLLHGTRAWSHSDSVDQLFAKEKPTREPGLMAMTAMMTAWIRQPCSTLMTSTSTMTSASCL